MLAVYRYHIPEISLPSDSKKILDHLKEAQVNMGMITDGRSQTQRAKIMALGLDAYIPADKILISEEVGTDKHWPTAFELMMKRNSSESSFTYIGDNPEKDFYWPNKLGWKTIMLIDKDRVNIHPQDLNEITGSLYNPQFTIDSLLELSSIV